MVDNDEQADYIYNSAGGEYNFRSAADIDETAADALSTVWPWPVFDPSSAADANATTSPGPLEESVLKQFSGWYQGVHGYVSLAICLFGIVSNVMNIVVLTHRSMITPTNNLLTALAIADLLTMVSYLPYAVYFHCISVPDERYNHPFGWVVYLLFNIHFTITTHTAAMWLTVALAVFRYIVVCYSQALGIVHCNVHRAKITIAAVFVATPIFCAPNYIKYRVVRRSGLDPNTTAVAHVTSSAAADLNISTFPDAGAEEQNYHYWFEPTSFVGPTLNSINFWLFGVVLKVVPCVLLTVLSGLLVAAMRRADEKRRRLRSAGRRDESERAGEHVRTTAMLVAVVLCFVAAELPQGVLALLSGIEERIFEDVYVPLGDVFDVVVLLNSAVNFVLYCTMSRQFRKTFWRVFLASASESSSAAVSEMKTKTTGGQRRELLPINDAAASKRIITNSPISSRS